MSIDCTCTSGGMLFQVMVVRGKKENRYTSARVYIVLKAAIPQSSRSNSPTVPVSVKVVTPLFELSVKQLYTNHIMSSFKLFIY